MRVISCSLSLQRAFGGVPESLRRITEDGITRARTDLAQRENEMQRLHGSLADNQKLLTLLVDMDRKARDIAILEQEQEKIIVLFSCRKRVVRLEQLAFRGDTMDDGA